MLLPIHSIKGCFWRCIHADVKSKNGKFLKLAILTNTKEELNKRTDNTALFANYLPSFLLY